MASCDVQATPSDENLEEDAAKVDNKVEPRAKNVTVLQPTKIPGPVSLDNSGSYVLTSTRKYTSLMKSLHTRSEHDESFSSTSTLVNTTEDSGVHMDCSAIDDDNSSSGSPIPPSSSTPRLQSSTETIVTSAALLEFDAAEQETLKVLQRAVAEMEADVALHADILEEHMKLDLEQQLKLPMEQQDAAQIEENLLMDAVEQQQQQLLQVSLEKSQFESPLESLQESLQDSLQEKKQQLEFEMPLEQSGLEEIYEHINQAKSLSANAGARERKHVRVEDLLQAEHDIELLQKLLQTDSELDNGEQGDLAHDNNETLPPDLSAGKDVKELERFSDNDAEWTPKRVNLLQSLLHIICGNGMRKLSYPILFCGMAVGLIYYFRKD